MHGKKQSLTLKVAGDNSERWRRHKKKLKILAGTVQ